MSEEAEKALRDFNAASSNVRKSLGGKQGDAAEKLYGQTYAVLVRLGIKPKLRGKYT